MRSHGKPAEGVSAARLSSLHSLYSDGLAQLGSIGCLGFQMSLSIGDQNYNFAVGKADLSGRPMTTELRYQVHCASKPLLAYTIGVLACQERISPRHPLGRYLPDLRNPVIRECLIIDVLCHDAGLDSPGIMDVLLSHPSEDSTRHLLFKPGSVLEQYSELAGWYLLDLVVEAVTGLPSHEAVTQLATEALCPGVFFGSQPGANREDEVGIYFSYADGKLFPWLKDVSGPFTRVASPAFGAYMSASDICGMYTALRSHSDETGMAAQSLLFSATRDPYPEGSFLGPMAFSAGLTLFQVGGRDVHGYHGWMGSSIGGCCDDAPISFGFICNGLSSPGDVKPVRDFLIDQSIEVLS